MPQFLNLIDALASHINAGNIDQAISFVEKMITLVESLKQQPPVAPPVS